MRALVSTMFGERYRARVAAVVVGLGAVGLYFESAPVLACAMVAAGLLAAGFFVEARPHDPWREYRKRRWDDP